MQSARAAQKRKWLRQPEGTKENIREEMTYKLGQRVRNVSDRRERICFKVGETACAKALRHNTQKLALLGQHEKFRKCKALPCFNGTSLPQFLSSAGKAWHEWSSPCLPSKSISCFTTTITPAFCHWIIISMITSEPLLLLFGTFFPICLLGWSLSLFRSYLFSQAI